MSVCGYNNLFIIIFLFFSARTIRGRAKLLAGDLARIGSENYLLAQVSEKDKYLLLNAPLENGGDLTNVGFLQAEGINCSISYVKLKEVIKHGGNIEIENSFNQFKHHFDTCEFSLVITPILGIEVQNMKMGFKIQRLKSPFLGKNFFTLKH